MNQLTVETTSKGYQIFPIGDGTYDALHVVDWYEEIYIGLTKKDVLKCIDVIETDRNDKSHYGYSIYKEFDECVVYLPDDVETFFNSGSAYIAAFFFFTKEDLLQLLNYFKKMENIMNEEIVKLMKDHVVEVTFTKVNGEKRVLKGTLQEKYLPTLKVKNEVTPVNPDVTVVWDIESDGFRSFRNDSVINYKVV